MIKITHLAHAGFLIENDSERLIIDPADDSFGYKFENESVNYLLISHNHFDYNNAKNINLKENNGSFTISEIDSYHDKEEGTLRGTNIIHVIETNGTRICHLGDLGQVLTQKQIQLIGNVDILLIPVGGFYTIDYREAIEIVNQLNPEVIIPMHYLTDNWNTDKPIDTVDKFLENIKDYKIVKLNSNNFNYEKSDEKLVYII